MRALSRLALVGLVLTGGVGCDQLTKYAADRYLAGTGTHSYFGDLFRLQYAQNPGAFLSLGESLTPDVRYYTLVVAVSAFLAGLLVWAVIGARLTTIQRVALAAVCAGGISNVIDRLRFDGTVTDFLNLGIGPLRTGIFNVADMVLLAGAIVLVLSRQSRAV